MIRLCWKGFYDRNDLEFVFYSAISDNPEIEANTPLDVSVSIGSADILSRPQLLDFLGTKYLGTQYI